MKELATAKKLPDAEIFRVVIEDPIQQLLAEGARVAQALGASPENVSVACNLQSLMEKTITNLPKRQFAQAKKLAQALQTWNLWKDPECTIPLTLDEAPPQYKAFVNAVAKRKE
ncbi:hypothetical protein A2Z23_01865 [Candidatus Curtissbacteria bacterium RBG_16_39_7]|uniref:Uncharacterized protein n=1 Tax=Candidatus Curtissbacteria bacterium RBG_16_39_7 TaxID=1797707 RepID=A0A1F5G222_9BACT|nr:MAG: hypothetical protein A2Z23_01865 [Candidatus Curtissbacteria bacterium RBG_16_39_7]